MTTGVIIILILQWNDCQSVHFKDFISILINIHCKLKSIIHKEGIEISNLSICLFEQNHYADVGLGLMCSICIFSYFEHHSAFIQNKCYSYSG